MTQKVFGIQIIFYINEIIYLTFLYEHIKFQILCLLPNHIIDIMRKQKDDQLLIKKDMQDKEQKYFSE